MCVALFRWYYRSKYEYEGLNKGGGFDFIFGGFGRVCGSESVLFRFWFTIEFLGGDRDNLGKGIRRDSR